MSHFVILGNGTEMVKRMLPERVLCIFETKVDAEDFLETTDPHDRADSNIVEVDITFTRIGLQELV